MYVVCSERSLYIYIYQCTFCFYLRASICILDSGCRYDDELARASRRPGGQDVLLIHLSHPHTGVGCTP